MGCCQTKLAKGGKVKLEAVDDEAPDVQPHEAPKKELTPENVILSASLAGDTTTVQTLLSSGAKVNAKGEKDYCALHNATRNGHTSL